MTCAIAISIAASVPGRIDIHSSARYAARTVFFGINTYDFGAGFFCFYQIKHSVSDPNLDTSGSQPQSISNFENSKLSLVPPVYAVPKVASDD